MQKPRDLNVFSSSEKKNINDGDMVDPSNKDDFGAPLKLGGEQHVFSCFSVLGCRRVGGGRYAFEPAIDNKTNKWFVTRQRTTTCRVHTRAAVKSNH